MCLEDRRVRDVAAFNRAQRSWVIVWLALTVLSTPAWIGVGSALSIYGVTQYVKNAKRAEAQAALACFSTGLARCAQEHGGLPESSRWVPEEVPHAQNCTAEPPVIGPVE
jgi:hypothetical protein